jgi:acetyl esterase
MKVHPQLQPFMEGLAHFPKAGSVPVETLRAIVSQSSTAFPPLPVPIGAITDRTIPGPGGEIPIRIYRPAATSTAPVIVYFHGGGWVVGDLNTQDMICRGLCHGAEAIVVSVAYRLAPEHPFPAAPEDCWAATQWIAAHVEELHALDGALAVAGDSAGAYLAAGVALRARDAGAPKISAQVLIYGGCNYPSAATPSSEEFVDAPLLSKQELEFYWTQYLSNPSVEQDSPLVSPVRAHSHEGVAPACILTAEIDPTRDDAERYGQVLVAAGVPVFNRRFNGLIHGFVSWLGILDGAQQAIDDAAAWLNIHFRRAAKA